MAPPVSSNITPDRETGIGEYSYEDFARALREGVAPGGMGLYPAMPYPAFVKIGDEDMRAFYAYMMHGVPPVKHRPPPTKVPFPFNQRWALRIWRMVLAPKGPFVPQADRGPQWNRGAYLVQSLGHCGSCHTPRGMAYHERGYDESSKSFLIRAASTTTGLRRICARMPDRGSGAFPRTISPRF